jgi:alpha-tubulin suppressor-like RCC1 family protein
MHALRTVAVFLALCAAGCVADRATMPAVFVLDDVGSGRWRTVSTGAEHSCAIDVHGRAYCWGSNASYQLGVEQVESRCGTTPEVPCSLIPVPVATGRTFISISAGGSHTCAIATDSVPYCWGNNTDGQLGTFDLSSPELRIPGTAPMIAISAGLAHSCGIRVDNVLVCWGSNRFGAITGLDPTIFPPTLIGGNQRFREVRASNQRTCARTLASRIMCWGALWTHASGDTDYATIRTSPTFVQAIGAMAAMDVGTSSTCSLDATGFAWCWETNTNGESGTGPGPGSLTPRRVASNDEYTAITLGTSHACAISITGGAFCWGSNRSGQLGALSTEYCTRSRSACSTRPIAVSGRQRFIGLSAGLGTHTCGVSDHLNLYCWGGGTFGQRGDGTRTSFSRLPRLAVDVHEQ